MSQVLHIFRKDVRHLWIEVSLSWVALALLGRMNWLQASPHNDFRWIYETQSYFVMFVVFAWWIVIARVIQDESLVGDRQFWVTRPYEWKNLLAAKVLFVVAVIYLPALVLYLFLLKLAGYPVLGRVAEILKVTGGTTLFLALPVAAFAVLTRKLSHWLMIVFGVVLLFFTTAGLTFYFGESHYSGEEGIYGTLQWTAVLALLCVVILIQYARRRPLRATLFLILAFLIIPAIGAVIPYEKLLERQFPLSTTRPLQLEIAASSRGTTSSYPAMRTTFVSLPVAVSGIAGGNVVSVRATFATIDTAGGTHWASGWQSMSYDLDSNTTKTQLGFWIDRKTYDNLKSQPSHVRLVLAMTELRESGEQRVVAQPTFTLPKVGLCWISSFPGSVSASTIECRSDGTGPRNLSMMLTKDQGGRNVGTDGNSRLNGGTFQILNHQGGGLNSIVPLSKRTFYFGGWDPTRPDLRPMIFPGTPLTFRTYDPFRSSRVQYDFGTIRLADYELQAGQTGAIGIDVAPH